MFNNNSSSSLASAKFIEDIRSGAEYTCWVEFEGKTKVIMVYLGEGFIKPVEPLLITRIEALDPYLSSNNGIHFVGLTTSSKGCTEVYQVHSWALDIEQKKAEEEIKQEQKVFSQHKADYETTSIFLTLGLIAWVVITVVSVGGRVVVYLDHGKRAIMHRRT